MEIHSVRIGEIIVARAPGIIEALALGSCVATFIYDDRIKLGACSHILLPASSLYRKVNTGKPGKYADTAIPEMIRLMIQKGAKTERLTAKLAGGARMFELTGKNDLTLDVGKRNIEGVKKALRDQQIPIIGDDIGSDHGRTVTFDLDTGILTIKVALKKVVKHI